MKSNDREYILPGHIIKETKLIELSTKYIKKVAKKHTKNWGIDVLELLSFLSLQKSPTIVSGGSYITDDKYLGEIWIAGSKETVKQKIETDKAARKIIELLEKFKTLETFTDESDQKKVRAEISNALEEYYGINTNLYFLYNKKENAIKIGRSKDIKLRKKALQTGSVNELKILYSCPARNGWENVFKKEFSSYRIRGEFYRADKEIFKFILWLKYVQENDLNPQWIPRNKYDNEKDYNEEMKTLLKEVK